MIDPDPNLPPKTEILQTLLTFRRGSDQVGASRIRLLEIIADKGSISAAAKVVGLSYKGAWDAVQALNNLSPTPLIVTQAGGRNGGVATVTPQGKALVAAYQRLERVMASYAQNMATALAADTPDIVELLGNLTMKTSARNAYHGVVTAIQDGAVNTDVTLKISDTVSLRAIITRESVEALGLKTGIRVTALIKSSFVVLASGHDHLPVSSDNRLLGVVEAVTEGAVNDEVTLRLDEGKTLTATITRDSRIDMGLKADDAAQALISASHIILALN